MNKDYVGIGEIMEGFGYTREEAMKWANDGLGPFTIVNGEYQVPREYFQFMLEKHLGRTKTYDEVCKKLSSIHGKEVTDWEIEEVLDWDDDDEGDM